MVLSDVNAENGPCLVFGCGTKAVFFLFVFHLQAWSENNQVLCPSLSPYPLTEGSKISCHSNKCFFFLTFFFYLFILLVTHLFFHDLSHSFSFPFTLFTLNLENSTFLHKPIFKVTDTKSKYLTICME